jgi:hypothetical protein
LCRNTHRFLNKEIYKTFCEINKESKPQIVFLSIHKTCENIDKNTLMKKCIFYECGCREHIVDIQNDSDNNNDNLLLNISTENLIKIANNY